MGQNDIFSSNAKLFLDFSDQFPKTLNIRLHPKLYLIIVGHAKKQKQQQKKTTLNCTVN